MPPALSFPGSLGDSHGKSLRDEVLDLVLTLLSGM